MHLFTLLHFFTIVRLTQVNENLGTRLKQSKLHLYSAVHKYSDSDIFAQAITLPQPCLADEVVCFGSWAVPFFLLFSSFSISLVLVDLYLICP